jgi:hypothetical protein
VSRESVQKEEVEMQGLAETRVVTISPSKNNTNKPKTYRARCNTTSRTYTGRSVCTHPFRKTHPPIIPRESVRQETKQSPGIPPHRTVTRHDSAQRKAEQRELSQLSSLGRRQRVSADNAKRSRVPSL